ncbi:MAG: hypothetical protein JNL87_18160 [Burkholderiaceae bacterium]|nr:hypothetical protein [Burkholderiaceae bacterium]
MRRPSAAPAGLRSFEGLIVGALLLFALQQWLGDLGAWYLAGLGAVAIGFALWLPQGLWGVLRQRRGWQLVSTTAHPPDARAPGPLPHPLERRPTP